MDFAAIQKRLNLLGATPQLKIDGQNGPSTQAAVRVFQQKNHLAVDGVVGPQTLKALGISDPSVFTGVPTELPDKATPMAGPDVAKAISAGYQKVTDGEVPDPGVLGLLIAHAAFETGDFGKGVHNYNFGNKKFSTGDQYYQFFACNEKIHGVDQMFYPPDPHTKFAAYTNSTVAGAAFVNLIRNNKGWWDGLMSGDATTYVNALKTGGYFTDSNVGGYIAGVERFVNQYASIAAEYAVPIAIAGGSVVGILAAIATGIYLWSKHA